jgi:drug/metabolite transporter (DMT)-like permease
MSWFYLALLAPLLYAIVNLFDDNLLSFVYKTPYLSTVFAGFFGAVPIVALLFKTPEAIPLNLALLAILAGLLTVGYYFFYFRSLEVEVPSVVIALFSLAPALLPVFAHFLLHERLSTSALLGFFLIIIASLGIAATDIKSFKFSAALVPVVIAVLFMDAAALLSKYAYDGATFYPVYMCFCLGMGLGGVGVLVFRLNENARNLRSLKKVFWRVLPVLIAAEGVNLAAELTMNLAISNGPVSLVKVIESIQPMYVLLIALILYPFAPRFFREAEAGGVARKFALMAVAIVGLGFVALASR